MDAIRTFALCDLVGVMNPDVIDAPGVNVELVSEIAAAHRRALDMPTRKAAPPGRIPLLLSSHIRRGELPECEVRGIALARNIADAPFRELGFEVEPRKLRVAGKFRGVEIDAIVDPVTEAVSLQRLDQRDLLGDVLGRFAEHLGRQAPHPLAVPQPLLGVLRGDFRGGLAALGGRALHLVFARIRIIGQMAHIGDVDDVGDAIVLREQRSLEQVREELGAEVADVLGRIDGRPAGVDAGVPGLDGFEDFLASRSGVVENERFHSNPPYLPVSARSATACAAMPSPLPIAPR